MADDPRAKLLKLLEALRELDEKRSAIYAEMDTLLAGGEGIGPRLSRLKGQWCEIWTQRHKEKCTFDHVKHTAFLKKKLLTFSEAEIIAKFQSYVTSEEAYYVRARHPFGLFMTNFDTWRGIPADTSAEETTTRLQAARGE